LYVRGSGGGGRRGRTFRHGLVLLPPQGVIFPNKEQWADVLIVWPEITVSLAVGTQLDAGNAKLLGTSLQVAETSHHSTLASHQLSTTTLPPIVSSLKGSPVRAPLDPWPACVSALERRLSLGSASAGAQRRGGRPPREIGKEVEFRGGSAINFPGNPRFRPRVAFKMASSTEEMDDRRYLLTNYALIVKEEGSLGLRSSEELKDLILHHFGIRKHEIYAYRSSPDPFIAIFSERRGRDLVFAAGRIIDGPVELRFRAWDLDEFGDRAIVPYHVKLSIEGIPNMLGLSTLQTKSLVMQLSFIMLMSAQGRRLINVPTSVGLLARSLQTSCKSSSSP
jgi:hypothetical protein